MKIYYEPGDKITIFPDKDKLHHLLREFIRDDAGRTKIVDDIAGITGEVVAVVENLGHKEVLYRKKGVKHSWKILTTVIDLPAPLITALKHV